MRTPLSFAAILAAAFLFGGSVAEGASPRLAQKPFHKGVQCVDCHGEKRPSNPTTIKCDGCHGSPADVAATTAGKYRKYYNPHDSLHHGTTADCVMCHREHSPSRLDCNNSNCHKEFTPRVP